MTLWNCRIAEKNDEKRSAPWKLVEAHYPDDAVKRYCGTNAWDHISWSDGDEAIVEVMDDGFVGEVRRYKVGAYNAIDFSVEDDDEPEGDSE